ncbi:MAG: MarC family protein, partial [Waddliaceae bacterium]
MPLLSIVITFFLVANPIGNSPAIIALIKDFDFERQKRIMFRESLFALAIACFFQYLGRVFLAQLEISDYTLGVSGGILLLLVALKMIFPHHPSSSNAALHRDPIIVPIATPLIAGPALLTIIMSYSKRADNNAKITLAIILAWIGVTAALVVAP